MSVAQRNEDGLWACNESTQKRRYNVLVYFNNLHKCIKVKITLSGYMHFVKIAHLILDHFHYRLDIIIFKKTQMLVF